MLTPTRLFLVFAVLLALLVSASHGTQHVIDYEGEHSNYGDHDRIKKHVKEHLKDAEHPEVTSEEDEYFYLFTIHDADQDGHLDGHELRQAFTDYDYSDSYQSALPLDDITKMVDHVLLEDDTDNDGKISWEEYLISQQYHEK